MKKREKGQYAVAAALALAGVVFIMVRLWGMRFSGFLLLGAALALALSALLDRLAARCGGGCCLDFLRTPGPVHRAVAQGLQQRLGNAPMLLPAAYHALAPEAQPLLSCLRPCNAWDGFVRSAERRFPNGWALELTPWAAELPAPPLAYPGGMLPAALCSCEKSPAGLRYFDTSESLRQKLAHAAAHGCRCAIGLWQELQPFFPERDG